MISPLEEMVLGVADTINIHLNESKHPYYLLGEENKILIMYQKLNKVEYASFRKLTQVRVSGYFKQSYTFDIQIPQDHFEEELEKLPQEEPGLGRILYRDLKVHVPQKSKLERKYFCASTEISDLKEAKAIILKLLL